MADEPEAAAEPFEASGFESEADRGEDSSVNGDRGLGHLPGRPRRPPRSRPRDVYRRALGIPPRRPTQSE